MRQVVVDHAGVAVGDRSARRCHRAALGVLIHIQSVRPDKSEVAYHEFVGLAYRREVVGLAREVLCDLLGRGGAVLAFNGVLDEVLAGDNQRLEVVSARAQRLAAGACRGVYRVLLIVVRKQTVGLRLGAYRVGASVVSVYLVVVGARVPRRRPVHARLGRDVVRAGRPQRAVAAQDESRAVGVADRLDLGHLGVRPRRLVVALKYASDVRRAQLGSGVRSAGGAVGELGRVSVAPRPRRAALDGAPLALGHLAVVAGGHGVREHVGDYDIAVRVRVCAVHVDIARLRHVSVVAVGVSAVAETRAALDVEVADIEVVHRARRNARAVILPAYDIVFVERVRALLYARQQRAERLYHRVLGGRLLEHVVVVHSRRRGISVRSRSDEHERVLGAQRERLAEAHVEALDVALILILSHPVGRDVVITVVALLAIDVERAVVAREGIGGAVVAPRTVGYALNLLIPAPSVVVHRNSADPVRVRIPAVIAGKVVVNAVAGAVAEIRHRVTRVVDEGRVHKEGVERAVAREHYQVVAVGGDVDYVVHRRAVLVVHLAHLPALAYVVQQVDTTVLGQRVEYRRTVLIDAVALVCAGNAVCEHILSVDSLRHDADVDDLAVYRGHVYLGRGVHADSLGGGVAVVAAHIVVELGAIPIVVISIRIPPMIPSHGFAVMRVVVVIVPAGAVAVLPAPEVHIAVLAEREIGVVRAFDLTRADVSGQRSCASARHHARRQLVVGRRPSVVVAHLQAAAYASVVVRDMSYPAVRAELRHILQTERVIQIAT